MDALSGFRDIAPHLANPLVLIGFALFLAFGIQRTLLKAGILKPVSPAHSSQIVRLLLKYGFYMALALILCRAGKPTSSRRFISPSAVPTIQFGFHRDP